VLCLNKLLKTERSVWFWTLILSYICQNSAMEPHISRLYWTPHQTHAQFTDIFEARKPSFRSLATLKLVANVIGEP